MSRKQESSPSQKSTRLEYIPRVENKERTIRRDPVVRLTLGGNNVIIKVKSWR